MPPIQTAAPATCTTWPMVGTGVASAEACPAAHEQDDTGEPGHGQRPPRPTSAGQEEQGDPADDRDGGPRQLEQSVPAREEVVGHRARLEAGGAGHDDRGGGRNEEEGRERPHGGARHRSTTDHDAVEDRNPECQQDAE